MKNNKVVLIGCDYLESWCGDCKKGTEKSLCYIKLLWQGDSLKAAKKERQWYNGDQEFDTIRIFKIEEVKTD
mgnify:CR=1 FL=1